MIRAQKDITEIAKKCQMFDDVLSFTRLTEILATCPLSGKNETDYEMENVSLLKDFGEYKKGTEFKFVIISLLEQKLFPKIEIKCYLQDINNYPKDDYLFVNYPELTLWFSEGGMVLDSFKIRKETDEEVRTLVEREKHMYDDIFPWLKELIKPGETVNV